MKRVENADIVKGITIVSISKPIDNPTDINSYIWKIFLKGDDLGYIKKVTYILHDTFKNPVRETAYPFVLEEKGWGEFRIQVRIKFIDHHERSVFLYHFLQLQDTECVSETYDEIVFHSPSEMLYQALGPSKQIDSPNEESLKIEKAIEYVLDEYEKLQKF